MNNDFNLPQDDEPIMPQPANENDNDLEVLRAERDEALGRIDQLLRAYAEADNARKRAEKERADALRYGAMKFARDMLDVADNMRRAIDAVPDAVKETAQDFIEGIELTEKTLLQAFSRHEIEIINPKGEKFDPNLHEAISQIPFPSVEANFIIDVMQTGYRMGDRLLRPARVVVSSGS